MTPAYLKSLLPNFRINPYVRNNRHNFTFDQIGLRYQLYNSSLSLKPSVTGINLMSQFVHLLPWGDLNV